VLPKLAIPKVLIPPRTATAIKDEKLNLAKLCRETADPRVRLPIEEIVLSYRKTSRKESAPPILVVARTERQLPTVPDDSTEHPPTIISG
jgi:hypothetical protein